MIVLENTENLVLPMDDPLPFIRELIHMVDQTPQDEPSQYQPLLRDSLSLHRQLLHKLLVRTVTLVRHTVVTNKAEVILTAIEDREDYLSHWNNFIVKSYVHKYRRMPRRWLHQFSVTEWEQALDLMTDYFIATQSCLSPSV